MADNGVDARLGRFIRFWRQVRKLSQEDLAELLDSSPRHISRLENGTSRPREAMIEDLAAAFQLHNRDRNMLRMAAGFSPRDPKMNFNNPSLKWLRNAMRMTLRALDPYPTVLSDSASNILMVNRGWVGLYSRVMPGEQLDRVVNHFELLFSHHGGGSVMSAWEDTVSVILMHLQQAALFNDNQEGFEVLQKFLQSPNVPADWQERGSRLEPMSSYRIQVEFDGEMRSFYSVMQQVGSSSPAVYVAEPVLYINTLYPEDETLDMSSLVRGDLKHPLLF